MVPELFWRPIKRPEGSFLSHCHKYRAYFTITKPMFKDQWKTTCPQKHFRVISIGTGSKLMNGFQFQISWTQIPPVVKPTTTLSPYRLTGWQQLIRLLIPILVDWRNANMQQELICSICWAEICTMQHYYRESSFIDVLDNVRWLCAVFLLFWLCIYTVLSPIM